MEERAGSGREERIDAKWWRNARVAPGRARGEVRVDAPCARQQRRPVARRQRDLLHGRDARRPGTRVEVTALGVAANGSAADVALVDVAARMVSARCDSAVVAHRCGRRGIPTVTRPSSASSPPRAGDTVVALWTPSLDPALPSSWDDPAPSRTFPVLALAALFVFLVLPSEHTSDTQTLVAAVLIPLGWLPWGTGISSQAAAWRLHAASAPSFWARVVAALLLAEAALHVPMLGSGWGEGYAVTALGYMLIVGGALALTLAVLVGAVTASRDRPAPPMPKRVHGGIALAVIVSTLGAWHGAHRPNPVGYLNALPRTRRSIPESALAHGRLLQGAVGSLGPSMVRCDVVHDPARGLDFVGGCGVVEHHGIYPMRAGDPEMTPVPWTLAAHAAALHPPPPARLLALLGLASTLSGLLARRRFRSRWATLDAFVDRFQTPDGALCEHPVPGALEVAVRLSTTPPVAGYREDAHLSAQQVIPGTVAALRERVACASRWADLSLLSRLAVTHAPLAVYLAHAAG